MKSEGMQIDFVDQQKLVQAYRVAADYALHSPFHTERERQERAEHYRKEAERLEAAL
jgi:hypothetical protein